MTHVFMELANKEKLKAQFGFSAVPFILVTADDQGTVALSGGLKKCSLDAVQAALEAGAPEAGAGAAAPIDVASPQQEAAGEHAEEPSSSSSAAVAEGAIPTFTFGEDEDF